MEEFNNTYYIIPKDNPKDLLGKLVVIFIPVIFLIVSLVAFVTQGKPIRQVSFISMVFIRPYQSFYFRGGFTRFADFRFFLPSSNPSVKRRIINTISFPISMIYSLIKLVKKLQIFRFFPLQGLTYLLFMFSSFFITKVGFRHFKDAFFGMLFSKHWVFFPTLRNTHSEFCFSRQWLMFVNPSWHNNYNLKLI